MGTAPLRPRVLLIHDIQAMRVVLHERLEAEGHKVSVSGETMNLTCITALAPDVIVQELLTADTEETD